VLLGGPLTPAPAPHAAGAQGVTVALRPAGLTVAPGAEFELSIDVTCAGSAFNGFDAIIGYDPAVLTPLPLTPAALQEGESFVAACANRFHRFRAGAGHDTLTDVLLCPATAITGPGRIYRLRFRASRTAQLTQVRFLPGLQFYNAGLFVNPDSSCDAVVGIGVAADSSQVVLTAPALGLTARPDSGHAGVLFELDVDRDGEQQLMVMDLGGRIVRRLLHGTFTAGRRMVPWDGRDDAGVAAPAGGYAATIRVPGQMREARFTLGR
jgi:hypothetical protein